MDLNISLNEEELSQSDSQILRHALNISNEESLLSHLEYIGKAAVKEYISMLSGGGIPNRADETKQLRLYWLISYYYDYRLPTESEIAGIFQLPLSQCRTLLKNTVSRFWPWIKVQAQRSMQLVIQNAEFNQQNENWEVIIESAHIKEQLDLIVSKKGPRLESIQKKKNSASQFIIKQDTYNLLTEELDINS